MKLMLDRTLTTPYSPERLASMSDTYAGQASWAIPSSPTTCRECLDWGTRKARYDAVNRGGELKPVRCNRRTRLMAGIAGRAVPHDARSCSQFRANPDCLPAISPAVARAADAKAKREAKAKAPKTRRERGA